MLPSISGIIRARAGDSLDFSMLLGFIYLIASSIFLNSVSLLRGTGYDAYVVSGCAPAWICNQDQSEVNRTYLGSWNYLRFRRCAHYFWVMTVSTKKRRHQAIFLTLTPKS